MAPSDEHLQVQFDVQTETLEADLSNLEKLLRGICEAFQVDQAVIDISIVDDAGMIPVHRQFLHKDATTDVISFDLSDDLESERTFELIVNAEMAARQAAKRGHSTEAELALYITHGMLHNLGFDDLSEPDARKMHEMEDSILQKHGFGIIYHRNELN